jgi:hypothetical protein
MVENRDLSSLIPPQATSLPEESDQSSDKYIATLIADFESLRADFQRLDLNGATLLTVAVTIATGIGAFLVHSCNGHSMTCTAAVWPPLYAFMPALPFVVIMLFADLGNAKTLKMYYTRAVETELQRVTHSPEVYFAGGGAVRLPAYGEIMVGIFGQHRGRLRYRFTVFFVYATIALLYLSTTFLSLWIARPIDLQVIMGGVYLTAIIVVLRLTWLGGSGARRLWREATLPESWRPDSLNGSTSDDEQVNSRPRSITAYLIVPRPHELFVRSWIIPVAWAVAAVSSRTFNVVDLWWSIGAMLVFEFLFYQARYIVNDLRSMATDAVYSEYKRRNRFPVPAQPQWVLYALISISIRVAAGIWASVRLLPSADAPILLIGAMALAGQCCLYEWQRSAVSRRVGRGLPYLTLGRIFIYATVGAGYLIRAWIGFALGGLGADPVYVITLVSVGVLAFGTMSVTMAWALSSVTQVVPPTGDWPSSVYRSSLLNYTHLGPLASQARLLARSDELECLHGDGWGVGIDGELQRWRLLERISSFTWWNVSAVILSGTSTGAAVAMYAHKSGLVVAAAVAVGGLVQLLSIRGYTRMLGLSSALVATAARRRGISVLAGGFVVFLIGVSLGGVNSGTAAVCGFVFASANYFYFRGAKPEDVEVTVSDLLHNIEAPMKRLIRRIMKHVIGEYAASLLFERGSQGLRSATVGQHGGPGGAS